ncbi:MAG: hypothetical protein U0X58_00770 [Flavobacteriaceae bacterium]
MQSKWKIHKKNSPTIFGFLAFAFSVFRLLVIFSKQLSAATAGEAFKVLLMGFRFDCTAVSYFVIIPYILLLAF